MITLETKPESIPVPDDADLEESPEDLLRRLESEKQDWKAQLQQMKATLEAQDRKIEEDRAKLREVLDKEEEEKASTRVVLANKAPGRIVNVSSGYIQTVQTSGAKIPAITEHARTVWPSIQEFHNMRARTVAKGVPYAPTSIPDLYLQTYGMGPPRSLNPGYPAGHPAAVANSSDQDYTVDGMGRVVRRAKVLGVVEAPNQRILNSSLTPSTSALTPSTVGVRLRDSRASIRSEASIPIAGRGSVASLPTTYSTAQPQQVGTGGWFSSIFGSTPATPVAQSPNVRYRYA